MDEVSKSDRDREILLEYYDFTKLSLGFSILALIVSFIALIVKCCA